MLGRFPRMEIIQREETDKFLIWNDLGKPRLRTMLCTPTQFHSFDSNLSGFTRGQKNGGQKTLQLIQVETV